MIIRTYGEFLEYFENLEKSGMNKNEAAYEMSKIFGKNIYAQLALRHCSVGKKDPERQLKRALESK